MKRARWLVVAGTRLDPESCRLELEDDSLFGERNEELGRECAAVGLGLVAALVEARLPTEILELTCAARRAQRTERA